MRTTILVAFLASLLFTHPSFASNDESDSDDDGEVATDEVAAVVVAPDAPSYEINQTVVINKTVNHTTVVAPAPAPSSPPAPPAKDDNLALVGFVLALCGL